MLTSVHEIEITTHIPISFSSYRLSPYDSQSIQAESNVPSIVPNHFNEPSCKIPSPAPDRVKHVHANLLTCHHKCIHQIRRNLFRKRIPIHKNIRHAKIRKGLRQFRSPAISPSVWDILRQGWGCPKGYPLVSHEIGFRPRAAERGVVFQQSVEFIIVVASRGGRCGFPREEIEFAP